MRHLLTAILVMSTTAHAARGPRAKDVAAMHPDRPVVVAHRGASGVAPENTAAAYREALAQGAIAAETDVFFTRDRQVIAIHDHTLDRTTSGAGPVEQTDWADVAGLDAGSWKDAAYAGEPVPRLEDLLAIHQGRSVLCIEIKRGAGIEWAIRDALRERRQTKQAIIFSFSPDKVAVSKLLMPKVPALFLVGPRGDSGALHEGMIDDALGVGADLLGLFHGAVDAEVVARAHAAGLPVFVWTVNDEADVRRAVEIGVDGIITDYPARTQAWVDDMRPPE